MDVNITSKDGLILDVLIYSDSLFPDLVSLVIFFFCFFWNLVSDLFIFSLLFFLFFFLFLFFFSLFFFSFLFLFQKTSYKKQIIIIINN